MKEELAGIISGEQAQEAYLKDLQRSASVDMVSGLLNRAATEHYIKDRLHKMEQTDTCALFIVDLDDFKQVNDILGHPAGDQVIRQTAGMLSNIFCASDIVGRLGGDEFAVFLCGQITEELVREKAALICEKLQMALGDRETVNVTASVGAYLAEKGQEFEGLYQSADLALYKAKKAGKHQFYLKNQDKASKDGFRPANLITLGGLLEEMGCGVALLEMGDMPQVIYVSPSYCRIMGADFKTFPLPMPLQKLIHPDDLVMLEDALKEGLQSKTAVEHTHRITGNGGQSWYWWHIRANQVEYDNPNPVILVTAVDVTGFKEEELNQNERISKLRIALNQTSKQLWEVDLSTGKFHAYSRDGKYRALGWGEARFPDNLIQGGWIHPNSVSQVRAFAEELFNGREQGFGQFAVRSEEADYYNWVSVSYRTLYDEVGRAVRAVGVMEELPLDAFRHSRWPLEQFQLPGRLAADLIIRMRANLELDTVEALWAEGSNLGGRAQEFRCSQALQWEQQKIFCRDEQQEFSAYFDREELLRLYHSGRRWLYAEYRRVDGSGDVRWVRYVLYLTEDPDNGQVYLFAFLLRLDPDQQLEPAIGGQLHRDGVTRLFDRESVRQIAESLLAGGKGGNCAVAVLQVNGLPQKTVSGGLDPDWVRYDISAVLSLVLGGNCILGQYSADQTVIIFPSVAEKKDLRRNLEDAVAFLRRILTKEPGCESLRFLMGVHLTPASAGVYDDMVVRAASVCSSWWNAATDTVDFFQETEDSDWINLPEDVQEKQMIISRPLEAGAALSEREKDAALRCVTAMLTARTLDASLHGVLQNIGEYYRADRVYTLMLVENQNAVIMSFEWVRPGKRRIQQVVSGMRLERFPLLKRCLAERQPVFLRRREPIDLNGEAVQTHPWYFAALPLLQGQQVEGFLCVENIKEHGEDVGLFGTLVPLLLQQRERFHTEERSAATMEQLMSLPDLRAYSQAVYSITSEYYSSMGVVGLDIPGFADINSRFGFEYGSKMLWYVAKTLTDLFGTAMLFRTWESEFAVFYPNTTREVFVGRCGRLRSILQRRYPKQIRIGRAWAAGVFTGKRLAEEARAAMRRASAGYDGSVEPFPVRLEEYPSVEDAIRAGRFTVYYQPRIDMRTGTIAGAEALVRAVADDGSIIGPSGFIEFMEEGGSIRELDLYILEQALSQMEKWRAGGKGIIPVSVNLSRVTLAHPSTLASVLAIQSRYPLLPASALELEVTERSGEIETAEIRKLAEKFHACGLNISLDDFGSQYANFSLFTNVQFQTVKLDRSLIAELANNPMNRTFVQDLVQLCRTYGMICVAEGVETKAQASALLEMGCIYAQGFLYDRPLTADALEKKYLENGSCK
jgi:hypothetical protein